MAVVGRAKRRILEALERKPTHGYELAKRTGLPLTGIYEHLRQLAGEGFVSGEAQGRRIVYRLTEKGRLLLRSIR